MIVVVKDRKQRINIASFAKMLISFMSFLRINFYPKHKRYARTANVDSNLAIFYNSTVFYVCVSSDLIF